VVELHLFHSKSHLLPPESADVEKRRGGMLSYKRQQVLGRLGSGFAPAGPSLFYMAYPLSELSVAVRRHDITVKNGVGLSITYRRQGRILEAIESIRINPSVEELSFYVRAWKAAFSKAQSLGWLY